MSAIIDVLRSFWRLFIWWVVVQPWEQGIRVRLGKRRKRLSPGLSFRIPYVDVVYKQSVRLRYTTTTPQTVSSSDGVALTVSGQLGYLISDIDKLYDTLQQAENAQLTTFCRVKTYRFIMDNHENVWEDLLNTRVSDIPSIGAKA